MLISSIGKFFLQRLQETQKNTDTYKTFTYTLTLLLHSPEYVHVKGYSAINLTEFEHLFCSLKKKKTTLKCLLLSIVIHADFSKVYREHAQFFLVFFFPSPSSSSKWCEGGRLYAPPVLVHRVYVPLCLCFTVSLVHHVYVPPCLCSTMSLVHRVYVHLSLVHRVHVQPCLCSTVS